MHRQPIDRAQVRRLLLHALEAERSTIGVYEAAMGVAVDEQVQREWSTQLEETRLHARILCDLLPALGLDPDATSPARDAVPRQGAALVAAIEMAAANGDHAATQLVAAECVALAEARDHLNWQLIGMLAESAPGGLAAEFAPAPDDAEPDSFGLADDSAPASWPQALGLATAPSCPDGRPGAAHRVTLARARPT
jgi:hypothetical protein